MSMSALADLARRPAACRDRPELLRRVEIAVEEREHAFHHACVPLEHGLPERVGQPGERADLRRCPVDLARLHERDDAEPAGEQLELGVTAADRGGEHLLGRVQAGVDVRRAGVGVAPRGERVHECGVVVFGPGQLDRAGCERDPAGVVSVEAQGDRQSRHDPRPRRPAPARTREHLLEERDLLNVEHPDLEPATDGTHPERRLSQRGRVACHPSGRARPRGTAREPGRSRPYAIAPPRA